MKKRLEKILTDLVTDYEDTRSNFKHIEDIASQEVAIQALANTLVMIQTAENNLILWQNYMNLQEEHKERRLQVKHMAMEVDAKVKALEDK